MGDEIDKDALKEMVVQGDDAGVQELLRVELKRRKRAEEIKSLLRDIVSCDVGEHRNGKSALHTAAMRGRSTICKMLLDVKASANAIDDTGNTPLHLAADLGRARAARHLLEAGADPNAMNNFGKKAAQNAVSASWDAPAIARGKDQIKAMLDGKEIPWEQLSNEEAPASKRGSGLLNLDTAAAAAAATGGYASTRAPTSTYCSTDLGFVTDLGAFGWHGTAVPRLEPTPEESRQQILEGECVAQEEDRKTMVALVQAGNLAGVKDAIQKMRRRSLVDPKTAVSCAEEGHGDVRIATSALHAAAMRNHVEIMKELLSTRANANCVDDAGNTPLHFAADLAHIEMCQVLLEAGASWESQNNFGKTPADKVMDLKDRPPDVVQRKRMLKTFVTTSITI
eukprot:TRINITY_DN14073_c0_g2_i2.p2 TRINITY_DN14073_c0_g2~~TRINITY_DN14073_c0_g2_i2.p2  ORF type:complete len:396 (+),score=110.87 TRINITY_DN14073_c0_g2_i2:190-1377(+)